MRRSLAVAAVVVGLAGCGDVTAGAEPGGREPDRLEVTGGDDPSDSRIDEPPPVTVSHGATVLDLDPWTACWYGPSSGSCSDGAPPDDPPDLGAITDAITVEFPADGWEFTATLRGTEGYCDLSIPVELEPVSDRSWTLPPTGPAGAYEVDLSGVGPEGDVAVTFAMRTTSDAPMPAPSADLALLYDIDGTATMFEPPTLGLQLLTPDAEVSASIAVAAADGAETTIGLVPATQECLAPGSIQLTEGGVLEPDTLESIDASGRFGPAPYAITVEVVIDGVTHVAAVAYPDDLEPESTTLRTDFEPPLPTSDAAAYVPFVDP